MPRWTWRLFGLFIAAPALALAWLGLRAVRAERIEGEQRLREQQTQIAQLADAAISTLLTQVETELHRTQARPTPPSDGEALPFSLTLVTFHRSGLVVFPRDKVYLGEFGRHPRERARLTEWPPEVSALVEQAQTAETQGHAAAALQLFERIRATESGLQPWADIAIARIRLEGGSRAALARLTDPAWATSPGLTPSGLPVAFVACAAVADRPADERPAFAPLVDRTLASLRDGRWWLSADERRFYGAELATLLNHAGVSARPPPDPRLAQLAEIDQLVRQSAPSRRNGATHGLERGSASPFLMLWTPAESDADTWIGAALAQQQAGLLIGPPLDRLFAGQPFHAAIRDASGTSVWPHTPIEPASVWHSQPLRAVRGWDLTFSGPIDGGTIARRQLLWYGFIGALLIMLLGGLGMTTHVVRQEMALTRRQSEFLGAVTHEFKSPITSIRLLLERIASGRVASPQSAVTYHAAIGQETDRLERLVNRLLEAQQIEAGQRHYNFAPESVEEVAADAIRHLEPLAGARNMTIELLVDPPIPAVRMDRATIADAVENLVDNAIKYSPPGTRIAVRLHAEDGHVSVEVEDQGIGIERDDIPHVFDKFYRARRGDLQNVRGTGLGLALVKAAVEAHGGRVDVSSQPGVGSRFSLRLPAHVDAEA